MDGWGVGERGEAESRTWLAVDLLGPVHELWAIEPGGGAASAVAELADGLIGEHRPELTGAALAGLLDLERVLVVGTTLEVAAELVEPGALSLVEDMLVDEACRLALIPLVNAAADLLLELRRDATQCAAAEDGSARAGAPAGEVHGDARRGEVVSADTTRARPVPCSPVRP